MITILLTLLGLYLGILLGRRLERGKIEMERAAYEERQAKRSDRPGTYQLNTIRFRR